MKFSFDGKLTFLFIFMMIGMVVAGVVTFRNSESVRDTDYLVQHTREVLYESEEALSLAQDVLLGSRGYVITGDSAFLEPFTNATKAIQEPIARLEELVKSNPEQLRRFDTLKKLIEERISLSVHVIDLRNEKGFTEAQQFVATRRGTLNMDEIRNTIHAIQEVENKLLNEQQQANLESTTTFNRSFYFLFSIILLVLIIVFFTVRYNLRVRKKAEEALFIKNEWHNQTLISLGDGVIATDANGVVTLINRAACELTGWTQEEAVGVHVDMVFNITNEKTGLRVISPLMEALRENKIIWLANHTVLKRKDDSILFIDDSGAPIHNQKNEVIGGVLIFRDITEKKKVEAELAKLKEELELIFNSVQDGIHGINKEGIIIFENPAATQMLGWEHSELVGKPAHATIHHTHSNGIPYPVSECCIYSTMQDGIVRRVESESFWRKDGTSFPVSYVSSPMRNAANEIIGAIVTFRDITERKKAEEGLLAYRNELEVEVSKQTSGLRTAVEELRLSEEMLEATGRLAKVGGWEIDLKDMSMKWTDEVYHIHELKKGEMPSIEDGINYYAPDARPIIQEAVNNAIATGEGWDVSLPFVTAKGNNIWVRAMGKTEMRDGKTVRVSGVFQDITEQKKAEDKLRKSIEQFKYASLASNDIIYDWDIINNAVWWNESYYKLIGIRNENKLLNLDSWTKLIDPEDHDRILKSVDDFLAGKEDYWSGEYKYLTTSKNIHHLSDRGFVMRDEEGKAYRMIGAMTDVTVWKQNIQDLEKIIFSLSHKVRQPVAHILGVATLLDNEMVTKEELKKLVVYMKESALNLDNFTHELTKHVSDAKSKTENKNWK